MARPVSRIACRSAWSWAAMVAMRWSAAYTASGARVEFVPVGFHGQRAVPGGRRGREGRQFYRGATSFQQCPEQTAAPDPGEIEQVEDFGGRGVVPGAPLGDPHPGDLHAELLTHRLQVGRQVRGDGVGQAAGPDAGGHQEQRLGVVDPVADVAAEVGAQPILEKAGRASLVLTARSGRRWSRPDSARNACSPRPPSARSARRDRLGR